MLPRSNKSIYPTEGGYLCCFRNFKELFIDFKIKFLFGLGQVTIECMKSMRVLTMMEIQVCVDEKSETD